MKNKETAMYEVQVRKSEVEEWKLVVNANMPGLARSQVDGVKKYYPGCEVRVWDSRKNKDITNG